MHSPGEGNIFTTTVPLRLDRLAWSRWHWRVVLALGITWILDGLEASLIANLGPLLEQPMTLHLNATQVGAANTVYLVGQVLGALLFGRLTDTLGRKKLFLVTLGVYLGSTALCGLSPGFRTFLVLRFIAGTGIGGEYSAINSAIDELIPARVRGHVDLAINGSYWIGVAAGALLVEGLLNPKYLPQAISWRLAFLLGAALGLFILLVRKTLPESPRWLLLQGHITEAEQIVDQIEAAAVRSTGQVLAPVTPIQVRAAGAVGLMHTARLLLKQYRKRTILGLSLMIGQTFFYNAIFFSFALILHRFYGISEAHTGRYMLPFAAGNFLGPLVLGRFFDTVGRRGMVAMTYVTSGVLLAVTGYAFQRGWLNATTQTFAWCAVFFFASAAASSAYLTVSELFPVEIRGLSIALFYAASTGAGAFAPTIFGALVQSQSRPALFAGYLAASFVMLAAGFVGGLLGVAAEGKSLEELAALNPPKDSETNAHLA